MERMLGVAPPIGRVSKVPVRKRKGPLLCPDVEGLKIELS
jgi:hypothetical protein